jgi:hypothetical protein
MQVARFTSDSSGADLAFVLLVRWPPRTTSV